MPSPVNANEAGQELLLISIRAASEKLTDKDRINAMETCWKEAREGEIRKA